MPLISSSNNNPILTVADNKCIYCPGPPPRCKACPKGQICVLTAQTCTSCPEVLCMNDASPKAGGGVSSSTPSTTAAAPQQHSDSEKQMHIQIIVGTICGLMGLVLILGIFYYFYRKKKLNKSCDSDKSAEKEASKNELKGVGENTVSHRPHNKSQPSVSNNSPPKGSQPIHFDDPKRNYMTLSPINGPGTVTRNADKKPKYIKSKPNISSPIIITESNEVAGVSNKKTHTRKQQPFPAITNRLFTKFFSKNKTNEHQIISTAYRDAHGSGSNTNEEGDNRDLRYNFVPPEPLQLPEAATVQLR